MYTPIKSLQFGSDITQIFRCVETSKPKIGRNARKYESTKFSDITGTIRVVALDSKIKFAEGKYYEVKGRLSDDGNVLFVEDAKITSVSDECDYIKSVPSHLTSVYIEQIKKIVKDNSSSNLCLFILDFADDKKLFDLAKKEPYEDDVLGSVIEKLHKVLSTAQKIDKISDVFMAVVLCHYLGTIYKNKCEYKDFDLLSYILVAVPNSINFKKDSIPQAKKTMELLNAL